MFKQAGSAQSELRGGRRCRQSGGNQLNFACLRCAGAGGAPPAREQVLPAWQAANNASVACMCRRGDDETFNSPFISGK